MKEILIHIGIITIGLLMALGIDQTVEYFHHRHQVAEARDALRRERELNKHYFASETEELRRILPILHTNLAVYQYLRQHPGAPKQQWPGELHWLGFYPTFADAAWKNIQSSNVIGYMNQSDVRKQSLLYFQLGELNHSIETARKTKRQLFQVNVQEADPSKLSPAQLDQQIALSSQLIVDYAAIANYESAIHLNDGDFEPAPNMEEFYAIGNVSITPEDKNIFQESFKKLHSMDYLEDQDSH
jgi:hypothetical protein